MFTTLSIVGRGTYGTVYKAQNVQNKEIIAVKKIQLSTGDEGIPATAIREIALLKELDHRNIIKLYDVLHSEQCLTMIFEYCDWDLYRYMASRSIPLSKEEIISFVYQMLLALEYIHKKHIIHRDVKPQNMLVNKKNELKLADFGLARSTFIPVRSLSTEVITLWYRPPEILLNIHDYGFAVDIWSAGCVLVEMITGQPLFECEDCKSMLTEISKIFGAMKLINAFPDFEKTCPLTSEIKQTKPQGLGPKIGKFGDDVLHLAERLLDVNPATRISAEDALKLPVFDSVRNPSNS